MLTVEWFDTAQYVAGAPGLERLTFQVQLYETTNVVEFHYCTLNANGATSGFVTGNSATVGIEALNGTSGTQHSSNQMNAINTMSGIRFTP